MSFLSSLCWIFNLGVYSFNSLGHTTVTSLDSAILYSCFLNSGADNTVNRCHPLLGISRWIRICTQSADPKTPLILKAAPEIKDGRYYVIMVGEILDLVSDELVPTTCICFNICISKSACPFTNFQFSKKFFRFKL